MDENGKLSPTFTRRAFIVLGAQAGVFGVLAGRLGWLQLWKGDDYRSQAESNRVNNIMIVPSRGEIVDKFGVPLAISAVNYTVVVVPEQAKDLNAVLETIRREIGLEDRLIKRTLKTARQSPPYAPVPIRSNLTWEQVARLELMHHRLPGVTITADKTRSYLLGEPTAHVIGYVAKVNKAEQQNATDPLLRVPEYRIGKSGMERGFESQLRGTPGRREVEVNVTGREVRVLHETPSKDGDKLVLTLDATLQQLVQDRLAMHQSAAAVVMDVHTGDVLACASHPSFDPNLFVTGLPPDIWDVWNNDPARPMNNKVLVGQYPPGSTFKMVTAMAALEAGVIDAHSTAFCPGYMEFGNHRFHCWKKEGHGTVNVIQALAQSCDTFFYKIANQVGIDKISEMANRLGLGQIYDVGIIEQKAGLLPTQAWKKKELGASWQQGETIVASIGQGYMLATPLQLAIMASRLVNGGKAVVPRMVQQIGSIKVKTPVFPSLNLNPAHLQMMKDGMDMVVLDPRGTAHGSRILEDGFAMGGKTGTSQVKRITAAERARGVRRQGDLPWHLRHHALFVGYAPAPNPRFACAVIVEHGESGSGAAAPVARDIMLAVQERAAGRTPSWTPAMQSDAPDGGVG
ncbi:MAG: penicillin-binding protein 2 [Pseudomonadota bacterium]